MAAAPRPNATDACTLLTALPREGRLQDGFAGVRVSHPYLCRFFQRSRFSLFLYLCRAIFLRRFLTTEPILCPWLSLEDAIFRHSALYQMSGPGANRLLRRAALYQDLVNAEAIHVHYFEQIVR